MTDAIESPEFRLGEVRSLFLATLAKLDELDATDEEEYDLTDLVPEEWKSEERLELARPLLVAVSILVTWRGSPRVSRGAGSRDPTFGSVLANALTVVKALRDAPGRSLTKSECAALLQDEDQYYTVASMLKLLGIAEGKQGQRGGLLLPPGDAVPPPPSPPPAPTPQDDPVATRDEAAFYPPAEAFLTSQIVGEESEARITGGQMVRAGIWNNPDVVGYKIEPCHSHETAIVRLSTVEVKLRLDRQGIAEATSHLRFAHYAWLAVPIARANLETPQMQELVRECVDAGIGLACYRQSDSTTFYAHLPPRFASPDLVQVEQLLSYAFDPSAVRARLRRARARIIAQG